MTSKKQDNYGRKFWCCPRNRASDDCRFFLWTEEFENILPDADFASLDEMNSKLGAISASLDEINAKLGAISASMDESSAKTGASFRILQIIVAVLIMNLLKSFV